MSVISPRQTTQRHERHTSVDEAAFVADMIELARP